MTLTELVVVVAVLAVLLGISVPTAKKLMDSLEHSAGARSLINAALTSARAMAASGNTPVGTTPVGIRFQQDRNGDFYMIFIYHTDVSSYSRDFVAFPNRKPIKLPEDIGVMVGTVIADNDLYNPDDPSDLSPLRDAQTFSIVFSEQGKMILFDVQVINRDGKIDNSSPDPVFNTRDNVKAGRGMFVQDTYASDGLGRESSVHSFYIYEKKQMAQTPADQRFSGCIAALQKEFINPYSGQLVKK